MFVAILAAFILPDLPHNSRGFTEEERQVAQLRMVEDVGEADVDAEGQGVFDGLIMAVKDAKIYLMMLTFTAYVVGLSFNAFFVSGTPQSLHCPHQRVGAELTVLQCSQRSRRLLDSDTS